MKNKELHSLLHEPLGTMYSTSMQENAWKITEKVRVETSGSLQQSISMFQQALVDVVRGSLQEELIVKHCRTFADLGDQWIHTTKSNIGQMRNIASEMKDSMKTCKERGQQLKDSNKKLDEMIKKYED